MNNENGDVSWQDTRQILHELEMMFNRDTTGDLEEVSDIKKMKQEIANHGAIRLKDSKEVVKGNASYSSLFLQSEPSFQPFRAHFGFYLSSGMMSQLSSKANDLNIMQQVSV